MAHVISKHGISPDPKKCSLKEHVVRSREASCHRQLPETIYQSTQKFHRTVLLYSSFCEQFHIHHHAIDELTYRCKQYISMVVTGM